MTDSNHDKINWQTLCGYLKNAFDTPIPTYGSSYCVLVVKPSMGLELQLRDDEAYSTRIAALPRLTMFDYEQVKTVSYGYLAIKCQLPDLIEAVLDYFYSIAYNRVVDKKTPLNSVLIAYEQLKAILNQPTEASENTLRGLWGELFILSQAIRDSNVEPDSLVLNWTGPQGQPNDFSFGKTAIEVKTTTKQKSIVEISSLDQLDAEWAWLIILHAYYADSGDGGESIDSLSRFIGGNLTALTKAVLQERINCVLNSINSLPSMQFSMKLDGSPIIIRVSDSIPLLTRSCLIAIFGEAKANLIERGKYILDLSSIEPSAQTVGEVFREAQSHGEQND